MKNSILIIILLFSLGISTYSQESTIVPKPHHITLGSGTFALTPSTEIVVQEPSLSSTAVFLNDYLKSYYGFNLKISKSKKAKTNIVLKHEKIGYHLPGAYKMQVNNNEVYIGGDNKEGVFYGVQSLIQLLPTQKNTALVLPQLRIEDAPRFAYRGLMLDVCRHYMPIDFIKRYIDYIALFKMNTFHWHLTDDQGWRIEIKKYPKLTTVGAWRDGSIIGRYPGTGNDNLPHGGYYTQEQVKEIVSYAAERNITVVPEIEMPGHASAAIAAYPFLSCFPDEKTEIPGPQSNASKLKQQNGQPKIVQETWGVFDDVFAPTEETFEFLQNVLDEVISLFPSKTIHIGGDECPKTNWKRSQFCQDLIKSKNLKDEHGLQSYFITRIEQYLNKKGRNIIGWDEILEGGLAPNAAVMSWRGEEGGIEAARLKHPVVMTPGSFCYFDHSQTKLEDSVTIGGYTPLEKVYSFEPIPSVLSKEEQSFILGAQANVWTEYILNPKKVEYMIFPRVAALSEVLWTNAENKNWSDFELRLPTIFSRFDLWKTNYSSAYYDLKTSILPTATHDGLLYALETKKENANIRFSTDGNSNYQQYTQPIVIDKTTTVTAFYDPAIRRSQTFQFNKATGKKITLASPPSPSYPGNGGAFGLVNGLRSVKGMSSSEWLGWNGGDMEAIIDLGKMENINELVVGTIESQGSWVYHPRLVELYTSVDGINFKLISSTALQIQEIHDNFKEVKVKGDGNAAIYVKVVAKNFGVIPTGLPGADHKAWLFIDEIEIR